MLAATIPCLSTTSFVRPATQSLLLSTPSPSPIPSSSEEPQLGLEGKREGRGKKGEGEIEGGF